MTKYAFSLILQGTHELTEDMADRLFAAGCDDGTPGLCNETFSIDFQRQAATLEAAIRSAVANVESAGYRIERVEIGAEAVTYPSG